MQAMTACAKLQIQSCKNRHERMVKKKNVSLVIMYKHGFLLSCVKGYWNKGLLSIQKMYSFWKEHTMNIWQLMLFIFMYKLVIVELSKINNTIMFFRHNFQNLKSYPKKYNNICMKHHGQRFLGFLALITTAINAKSKNRKSIFLLLFFRMRQSTKDMNNFDLTYSFELQWSNQGTP